jgi:hypothetical protein
MVSQFWLPVSHKRQIDASHLRCAGNTVTQRQAAVKLHGVFTSHKESLVSALGQKVQRIRVRDSNALVIPFMQVAN